MIDVATRIDELLQKKGVSGYRMCADLNMSRSFMTELRKGRTKGLTLETAGKIAEYFGTTTDYLLGNEKQKNTPTLSKKDERDIAHDLEHIMEDLNNGGALMFDGDPMTDEAKESVIAAMKLGLEAAKLKNKARFTPKKYREKEE